MITSQSEYKRLKRRLTFRRNRLKQAVAALKVEPLSLVKQTLVFHEAGQLLQEASYAESVFERVGFPDAWAHWERDRDDARWQINRYTRI